MKRRTSRNALAGAAGSAYLRVPPFAAAAPQAKFKRGVALYSYQEEYHAHAMTLEDCIAEVASMGAEGVEIVAEMMVPNYPNPPDRYVEGWQGLLEKYHTKPACLDTFVDVTWGGHRKMKLAEAVDTLTTHLKLARKLGFPAVRPTFEGARARTLDPLEVIAKALPEAERHEVKIALEIHAPASLNSQAKGSTMEHIDHYLEFIAKTNTKYFGFTPDMGIFVRRLPRVMLAYLLRHGAQEKIVRFVDTAYQNRVSSDDILTEVLKMGGNQMDQQCAYVTTAYGWPGNDPKDLEQIMPYIHNIHAKFYEMTENFQEYSTPYEEIIPVLIAGGYDKYINSEYEGQIWTEDTAETDSCEQVRRQHVLLKRLMGV